MSRPLCGYGIMNAKDLEGVRQRTQAWWDLRDRALANQVKPARVRLKKVAIRVRLVK